MKTIQYIDKLDTIHPFVDYVHTTHNNREKERIKGFALLFKSKG